MRCLVTVSSQHETLGYQLETVEVLDFKHLFTFLNDNEKRSKVQKIILKDEIADKTISLIVESIVKTK
jgi:hypothetical protein